MHRLNCRHIFIHAHTLLSFLYLQKLGTGSQVSGITLSTEQVRRANELAGEQGINNAEFQVMDALKMTFPVRDSSDWGRGGVEARGE